MEKNWNDEEDKSFDIFLANTKSWDRVGVILPFLINAGNFDKLKNKSGKNADSNSF